LRPDDTLALYVTALSSSMAGTTDPKFNTIAIDNYKQLVAAPTYNGKPEAYNNLTSIYLANKDTADAYKIISDGVQKYPDNSNLRNRAIIIGLQYGKQDDLIGTIETAIKSDPKNKLLYYYEGLTYSQIAEAYSKQRSKTKDPVAKSAFDTKINDNFSKAAVEYQKALGVDPNDADASLNLAYVSIKPLINLYNEANQLPTNEQKLYDADMAKVKVQLDVVQPVMLKAVDLNPTSAVALSNLKTFYLLKNDTADANATQKKIDALPSK
jgi:tetratricopeptide (TPR) repeat protein